MVSYDMKLVVKAVLFDIGDTLINASAISAEALRETAKHLLETGVIANVNQFLRAYGEIDKGIHGPAVNHLFSDVSIIAGTLEAIGIHRSLKTIEIFLATYRASVRRKIRKGPRLVDLFARLRNTGFALGVVTDGTTTEQTEQLTRLGILEKLDVCITSEALNIEKPNPLMFSKALDEIRCGNPRFAAMVGNDVYRDIFGAQQAGLQAVLVTMYRTVPYPDASIQPDLTISSVYDLPLRLRTPHESK